MAFLKSTLALGLVVASAVSAQNSESHHDIFHFGQQDKTDIGGDNRQRMDSKVNYRAQRVDSSSQTFPLQAGQSQDIQSLQQRFHVDRSKLAA